jgi:hypothetical protein
MLTFNKLGDLYVEIENYYAKREFQARTKGYNRIELDYNLKRKNNDQAYFLFMFTRLEDRIIQITDQLIKNKCESTSNWKKRRSWEVLNIQREKKTIHFMNRVSLLIENNNNLYQLLASYHKQRNIIAHGGNFTIPINMVHVIANMKTLHKSLNYN